MKYLVNHSRFGVSVLVVALWTVFVCPVTGREGAPQANHPQEEFVIAVPKTESSALVRVAVARGFLGEEGLDVRLEDYENGGAILDAVVEGRAHLGLVDQSALVARSFERTDFRILAMLYMSDENPKLVARRDRGIRLPQDVRGKRIGTSRGEAAHFFLQAFVSHHGLPLSSLRVKYGSPEQLLGDFLAGKLDGFVSEGPHVFRACQELADKAIVFSGKDTYISTLNLVVRAGFLKARPAWIKSLLRSLTRAELFIEQHPSETQALLAHELGLDRDYLREALGRGRFMVRLDQSLLILMEREARWMMRSHLVKKEDLPNYLPFIAYQPLEEVRPEAVGLIH